MEVGALVGTALVVREPAKAEDGIFATVVIVPKIGKGNHKARNLEPLPIKTNEGFGGTTFPVLPR